MTLTYILYKLLEVWQRLQYLQLSGIAILSECVEIEYRIARKFGGELNMAVYITTAKLKLGKISHLHIHVWRSRIELPNLNPIAILGSTAKFNSLQYFWLYVMVMVPSCMYGYLDANWHCVALQCI